jgi:RNA polymerase sigma-70 factor (ECF subfamily)
MEAATQLALLGGLDSWFVTAQFAAQSQAESMNRAEQLAGLDDEELFSRVAGGDAEAFATFYDRHASLLFSVAVRIVGQDTDAEDVLQDAAVLIWERAPQYDRALGRPLSWAVTLTRNKAIDRVRSTRRKLSLLSEIAEEATAVGSVGDPQPGSGVCQDLASLVRSALKGLAEDQQRAIELAFFGGLSQSEIAERLGEPLGTVKARIRRGMLHLRDVLEGLV